VNRTELFKRTSFYNESHTKFSAPPAGERSVKITASALFKGKVVVAQGTAHNMIMHKRLHILNEKILSGLNRDRFAVNSAF